MNPWILIVVLGLFLALAAHAGGTRREVVRDSSGRLLYTVEHREGSGDTSQATIRDASGRLVGTATTRKGSGDCDLREDHSPILDTLTSSSSGGERYALLSGASGSAG